MLSRNPLVVEVTRGPVVESTHEVVAVVCDSMGRLINGWGNSQFVTVPRSAIKMLQALPLIESGAFEKFGLTDEHLALAMASHRGEKQHLDVAKDWLKKISLSEADLACGGHLPYNEKAQIEFFQKGEKLGPLYSNCVGKHLAMLTTALHLKENIKGYEDPNHPVQVRIRKVLTEAMGMDMSKVPHAVDGCTVPTYPVPLQNLAMGMGLFLSVKESELRKMSLKKISTAYFKHPVLASGSDDFSYELSQKISGKVMLKGGAEGVYVGVSPERGISFALKVVDGSQRAAHFTAAALLQNLKIIADTEVGQVKNILSPNVVNSKGQVVGQFRFKRE